MMGNEKRYNMIDVLRLVAAVLVVSIHTTALLSFGENAWIPTSLGIARIAVPFFFIVTGYFFYERIQKKQDTKSYIKRLFRFYITWVIIEVVLLIPLVYTNISSNPGSIIGILLVGVTGSLWYISSSVMALLVTTPLLKRNKFGALFIISIILYIVGLGGDSYFGIAQGNILGVMSDAYTSVFVMANIGFTCSVPFIVIGAAINKYNLKDKIKFPGNIAIVGIILLIIEAFVLFKTGIAKDYNMYVSLLIVTPAIFIWAMNSKFKISDNVAKICREYSIGIYCTHQTFMIYCFMLLGKFMEFTLLRFAITFGVATIVTFILTKFKITRKYLLMSK